MYLSSNGLSSTYVFETSVKQWGTIFEHKTFRICPELYYCMLIQIKEKKIKKSYTELIAILNEFSFHSFQPSQLLTIEQHKVLLYNIVLPHYDIIMPF